MARPKAQPITVEESAQIEVGDPPPPTQPKVVTNASANVEALQKPEENEGEEQIREEFNKHVELLARNAAQQEIASLDERIRDLEQVVQVLIGQVGAEPDPSAKPSVDVGVPQYDVPEYKPEHQNGGVPWYTG